MRERAGYHLRLDPERLRFTTTRGLGLPEQRVQPRLSLTINEILKFTSDVEIGHIPLIFYELSSEEAVRNLKQFEIIWLGKHNKEERRIPYHLPTTTEIFTVRDILSRQVSHLMDDEDSPPVNIFSIFNNGKQQWRYADSVEIKEIDDETVLYAEVRG